MASEPTCTASAPAQQLANAHLIVQPKRKTHKIAGVIGPSRCCFGFLHDAGSRSNSRIDVVDSVGGTPPLTGRIRVLLALTPWAFRLRAAQADRTTVRATLAEGERESERCRVGGRCSAGLLARLYEAGDTSMARKWKKARGAALSVTWGVMAEGGSGTGSERCMMFDVNERQPGVQSSCCLVEKVVGGTEWSFRWLLDGVEAGAGGAWVVGGVVEWLSLIHI